MGKISGKPAQNNPEYSISAPDPLSRGKCAPGPNTYWPQMFLNRWILEIKPSSSARAALTMPISAFLLWQESKRKKMTEKKKGRVQGRLSMQSAHNRDDSHN